MDRDFESPSDDEGRHFEQRALLAGETEIKDDDDLDRFEAVKGDSRVFSLSEYFAFFTMGLPMMWIWSMIIQAAPYFQRRFAANATILRYFQASFLVFFATTMFLTTVYLNRQREQPMYTHRLKRALCGYVAVASLLMLSAVELVNVRAEIYYPFTLVMVVMTGVANGLSQNAAFAFAAGFGRTEYAPAVMTGEALAGFIPSSIEIISALVFPTAYFDTETTGNSKMSSLTIGYFFSALVVGLASLGALGFLIPRSGARPAFKAYEMTSVWARWSSTLKWPALANFSCLCISSVSSVFVTKITSVVPRDGAPTLLRPEAFIPLSIVLWNIGDFLGSLGAVSSRFLIRRPFLIFVLSLARIAFIPMYLMCNIDERGSFAGDWFYLVCVQFMFGVTHGWLSGASMMGVPVWVPEEDREEAGAFMGMTLVSGLVAGSILGLIVSRV
ncbi:nucleoside transporter-domain-containing protein [Leptodontidium sp. 2 PMI_412]|nr:nucleoside transporter-domain-containing protein [Leptodontidium sp. 2 PMI_412]